MTTVLVVDDEPQIARTLRINLTARGYEVIIAPDGATALRAVTEHKPDVVVLDLGLPDLHGATVIERLRRWTTTPIVVLSARTDSTDKVLALDAGADDYVTKPFGMDELLARLRAALRRAANSTVRAEEAVIETDDFVIDLAAKRARRNGQNVHLTPTEWGLLEILARNPDKCVTQKQLLREIWGPEHQAHGHYLRVYFAQLRRKLEPDPTHPRYLITEAGIGYRLEHSRPAAAPGSGG